MSYIRNPKIKILFARLVYFLLLTVIGSGCLFTQKEPLEKEYFLLNSATTDYSQYDSLTFISLSSKQDTLVFEKWSSQQEALIKVYLPEYPHQSSEIIIQGYQGDSLVIAKKYFLQGNRIERERDVLADFIVKTESDTQKKPGESLPPKKIPLLKTLKLGTGILNPAFKDSLFEYQIPLKSSWDSTQLFIELADTSSRLRVEINGDTLFRNLSQLDRLFYFSGTETFVNLHVYSPDTQSNYILRFIKATQSESRLAYLHLIGGTWPRVFKHTKLVDTLLINYGSDSLQLHPIALSTNSQIIYQNIAYPSDTVLPTLYIKNPLVPAKIQLVVLADGIADSSVYTYYSWPQLTMIKTLTSQAGKPGQNFLFKPVVHGLPKKYSWYINDSLLVDEKSDTLKLFNVDTTLNNAQIKVQIEDGISKPLYSVCTLSVQNNLPQIIKNPEALTRYEGESAIFTVEAKDVSTYQWQINRNDVLGQNQSSFKLSNLSLVQNQSAIRVRLNQNPPLFSNEVILTVKPLAPENLTLSPEKAFTVKAGEEFLLRAKAEGPSIEYEWYRNKDLSPFSTSQEIALFPQKSNTGDLYYFKAKNPYGEATSSSTALTVRWLDLNIPNIKMKKDQDTFLVDLETSLSFSDSLGKNLDWTVNSKNFLGYIDHRHILTLKLKEPKWSGKDTLTLEAVSPEGFGVKDAFELDLLPSGKGPQILSLPTQKYKENEPLAPLDLTSYLEDPDFNDSSLTLFIKSTPRIKGSLSDKQNINFSILDPAWSGFDTLIVTVTNPLNNTASSMLYFEISPVNDSPLIESSSILLNAAGEVPLTTKQLKFSDEETEAKNLVLKLLVPPEKGKLILVPQSGWASRQVLEAQSPILWTVLNNGTGSAFPRYVLSYSEIPQNRYDKFTYLLSDGNTTIEGVFEIRFPMITK